MEVRNGPSRTVFTGRALSVRVDPVRVRGRDSSREVVERVPAVAVVAEDRGARLAVIRQWRWAVGEPLWEIPAGKIDPGEPAAAAAVRELKEETGFTAGECRPVLSLYPSPGYTTERIELFYARDLLAGSPEPDEEEEIVLELWDEARIRRALAAGEVRNAITLLGLYWWLDRRRQEV